MSALEWTSCGYRRQRKARKAHRCDGVRCPRSDRAIAPGEAYVELVRVPWCDVWPDSWARHRLHAGCEL